MCKLCVDEGRLTVDELDEAVMAGDTSVIDIRDRLAAGVDPMAILLEVVLDIDEPAAREILRMTE
jgi:hypothetical protein